MSKENVFAFWQEVEKSAELQERLRALSSGSAAETAVGFVRLANERGFAVTSEEVAQIFETGKTELADEELEAITGGSSISFNSRIRLMYSSFFKPTTGQL